LPNIGILESAPCAVANVKDIDALFTFHHAIDHAINVRLATVEKLSELRVLTCHRTAVREPFQAENGIFESSIPPQRCVGVIGVDLIKQAGKVALCSRRNVNVVCHG
jgi:hypothetical protein